MRIQVAKQSPPDLVKIEVEVPAGSTIASALALIPLEIQEGWSVSVWGEIKKTSHVLEEGDRIEICAPLVADPKEARRLRQQRQELAKAKKDNGTD